MRLTRKTSLITVAFLMALTMLPQFSNKVLAAPPFLTADDDKVKIENVHYTVSDGRVIINYDLIGDPNNTYNVQLTLKRQNYDAYNYTPNKVSGDVGTGKFAGKNREIIWNVNDEFPQGLPYSDYYFIVTANESGKKGESSGFFTFSWLKAGVVAAVAVATIIFISKNKKTGSSGSSLPGPPGRPQ